MKLSVRKIAVVLVLVMAFSTCEAAFAFSWTDVASVARKGIKGLFSPSTLIYAGAAACIGGVWGSINAYAAEEGKGTDAFIEGFTQGFKLVF